MARKKSEPVSSTVKNLLRFQLDDDHISDGEDQVFFLRIHPPNMVILSKFEKVEEAHKLQAILDGADISFDIYVMDKAESLESVKSYYESRLKARPEFDFVFNGYIQKIDTIDINSASIQRAFYLVVRVRDRQRLELFVQQVRGKLDFTIAQKDELEIVMRNYLLHEYISVPVYSLDREIEHRRMQLSKFGKHVLLTREKHEKYEAQAANESILTAAGKSITEDMQAKAEAAADHTKIPTGKEGEPFVQDENQKKPGRGIGSASGGLWPFG